MTQTIRGHATPLVLAAGAAVVLAAGAVAAAHAADPATAFTVLVAAAAAAGALAVVPRIEPAWPLALGLILSVFSSNWSQLGVPVGLDRPLVVLGLAAVVVRALPDAARPQVPPLQPIHGLLAVVSIYAIGSALFAGTLFEREPLFGLTDKLGILSFALFFAAPVAFATAAQRNVLLVALVGLGAYLGLTALFETVGLRALVFPGYINDPSVGIHPDRARGPFVEAAANGLALYVCAVACAVALAVWERRAARRTAAVIGALCLLGLLFTLTRQVWLGAAAATLVTLLAAPGLRRYLIPTAIGMVATVLFAFAFIPGLEERASERSGSRQPVWDRLNSNRAAVRMIEDQPLVGFGWYRFEAESPPYYQLAETYPMTTVPRPHSVFLATAVELGLIGFLAWLAALVLAIGGAITRRGPPELAPWRWGLLAVAFNWAVVANFTPLGYAFPNTVVWLWAGVVVAGSVGLLQSGARRAP